MKAIQVLSVVFLLSAFAAGCTYDYLEPVLVFVNNKVYDLDKIPFIFNNYQAIQDSVPISSAELEAIRERSIQWLKTGFGFPNTDHFNSTTLTTTFPGIGDVIPIFFNDSYALVSSNDNEIKPKHCFYLQAVEFVFLRSTDSTAVPFTYGGKYGQLMDTLGQPASSKLAQPGDGVSFGYYYVMKPSARGPRVEKRLAYKSILPNRQDQPFRSHQEMILKDAEWGSGMTTLEIQSSVNQDGKYVSQIINNMKFNDPYNVFESAGIHISLADLIVP